MLTAIADVDSVTEHAPQPASTYNSGLISEHADDLDQQTRTHHNGHQDFEAHHSVVKTEKNNLSHDIETCIAGSGIETSTVDGTPTNRGSYGGDSQGQAREHTTLDDECRLETEQDDQTSSNGPAPRFIPIPITTKEVLSPSSQGVKSSHSVNQKEHTLGRGITCQEGSLEGDTHYLYIKNHEYSVRLPLKSPVTHLTELEEETINTIKSLVTKVGDLEDKNAFLLDLEKDTWTKLQRLRQANHLLWTENESLRLDRPHIDVQRSLDISEKEIAYLRRVSGSSQRSKPTAPSVRYRYPSGASYPPSGWYSDRVREPSYK